MNNQNWRMWGGRFKENISNKLLRYTTRTDIEGYRGADYYLVKYEILANLAHILMLMKQGIINDKDGKTMLITLKELMDKEVSLDGYEDIHSYIEKRLIETSGKTPHICRSRNDQVILLERLFMREGLMTIISELIGLIMILINKSTEYKEVIIPVHTHWRQADLTTLTHLYLSYTSALLRDIDYILGSLFAYNLCPLGASAISGCILDIDREYTAELLGFKDVQKNTVDVITSRWEYQAKYLFTLLMVMKHLSIVSKDIIFYSMDEVEFMVLPDQYSTGSSALPHKKNPDALELLVGKSSTLAGYLLSLISLGGEATGYHRETQEGKWIIIKATEDVVLSIDILKDIIENLKIEHGKLDGLLKKYLVSTEIANYISFKSNISFRTIHKLVGKWVRESEDSEKLNINYLIGILQKNNVEVSNDVVSSLKELLDPNNVVKKKNHLGAPGAIDGQIDTMKRRLKDLRRIYKAERLRIDQALEKLMTTVDRTIIDK
jgi:argininosuccinate lyase